MYTGTHEPLFRKRATVHDLFPTEKTAAVGSISRMPDDEKKWPAHIFSELQRNEPYLAKYDVDIVLDRMEPEAGAALGYAQIHNKTLSRPQDAAIAPGNVIRVPIIVQERRLQKFHIFECGKQTYPLTEDRVAQAMLNPTVFDTDSSRIPVAPSLVDQLFPPGQQRNGFGRVSEPSAMGLSKLSSVDFMYKEAADLTSDEMKGALSLSEAPPETQRNAAMYNKMCKRTGRPVGSYIRHNDSGKVYKLAGLLFPEASVTQPGLMGNMARSGAGLGMGSRAQNREYAAAQKSGKISRMGLLNKESSAPLTSVTDVHAYLKRVGGNIQGTQHKPTGKTIPFVMNGAKCGVMTTKGVFQEVHPDTCRAFAESVIGKQGK